MPINWKDTSVVFKDDDVVWKTASVIAGKRVFDFVPAIGIKESLEWVTDILMPRDGIGSEQRISVRPIPRQRFSYTILLRTEKEQSQFEAIMFGWQKKSFILPIWTEKMIHTGTITAEDRTIVVDTTISDFRDDGYVKIWKSSVEHETVRVLTVTDNLLTLGSSVVETYTGNKFIMPSRTAQIIQFVKRDNEENNFSIAQSVFAIKNNILLSGYVADQSYAAINSGALSFPIISTGSVIGLQNKEYMSDSDSYLQDYGVGDFDYFSDSEFNLINQNWTFRNDTRAKCWNFRLFLHSLVGMQGTCWIPTYKEDLIQIETISAADTVFSVENIGLSDYMTFNALRTHLAFIFPNGTIIPKEIVGISEDLSGNDEITIDSALGEEVAVGDCIISFLDLSRQASDVVNIDWFEFNKNSANQMFITVKE